MGRNSNYQIAGVNIIGRYTTVDRVQRRLKDLEAELPTTNLEQMIEDAESYINSYTRQIFAGDKEAPAENNSIDFNTARSAATSAAAFSAVVHFVTGKYTGFKFEVDEELLMDQSGQVENYLRVAFELRTDAQRSIFQLPREAEEPVIKT